MNYAIPGQRLNTTGFNRQLAGLSPQALIQFDDPDNWQAAYDWYIRALMPSYSQENAMREMFSQFIPRYKAGMIAGDINPNTRWTDYLRSLDIGTELARQPRQARDELQAVGSFGRPGRYISF